MAGEGRRWPQILCAKATAQVLVQLRGLFLSAGAKEEELQAREGSAGTFGGDGGCGP